MYVSRQTDSCASSMEASIVGKTSSPVASQLQLAPVTSPAIAASLCTAPLLGNTPPQFALEFLQFEACCRRALQSVVSQHDRHWVWLRGCSSSAHPCYTDSCLRNRSTGPNGPCRA